MSTTPLCRSTAYLSGVKDEVTDLKKQLSYIKDDIFNLQGIKSKLLLIQSNQKEDSQLMEHYLKSSEINQNQMKTELSTEIKDLRESVNHEKDLREMVNTIFNSKLETELQSVRDNHSKLEQKIVSEQNSLKNDIEKHWQEFINQSENNKKLSEMMQFNFDTLLRLINNNKSEIDEHQKKQENIIFGRITNLEQEILKTIESTENKFHQQEEAIKTNEMKITEQISNLKTQIDTNLAKNEKDLRKLIEEKWIDIMAEQKLQKQSFQNYCVSFDDKLSEKLDDLQQDLSNKLLVIENIEENQQKLSQKNFNLNEKLENTFENFDNKLDNVFISVKLLDDKYITLEDKQKTYENSLTSICNSLIEPHIFKVQEDQRNILQQVLTNAENQKTNFNEQTVSINSALKTFERKNLDKIMEELKLFQNDYVSKKQMENEYTEIINIVKEECTKTADVHRGKEELLTIGIKHLNDEILKLNKNIQNEINEQLTENTEKEKNISEEVAKLKSGLTNVQDGLIQKLQKLIDTNHNEFIIQNKSFQEQFKEVDETFSTINNLQSEIFSKLMDLSELKEKLSILSQENSNFKNEVKSECEKIKVSIKNENQSIINLVDTKNSEIIQDQHKNEKLLRISINRLKEEFSKENESLRKQIDQQLRENEENEKNISEEVAKLKSGLANVQDGSIKKLQKLIDTNHHEFIIQNKSFQEQFKEVDVTFSAINNLQCEISSKLIDLNELKKKLSILSQENSNFKNEVKSECEKIKASIENENQSIINLVDTKNSKIIQDQHENEKLLRKRIDLLEEEFSKENESLRKQIDQQLRENEENEKNISEEVAKLKSGLANVQDGSIKKLQKLIDSNHIVLEELIMSKGNLSNVERELIINTLLTELDSIIQLLNQSR